MKRLITILLTMMVLGSLFGCASAEFEVTQIDITPSQVNSGESVTVKAMIKNSGKADGVYTASLTVNEIEKEVNEVFVKQNSTQEVSFTLTEQTPGIYNISIGDETATFTVLKQPSGEEIADDVTKAMYDVKTYQFEQEIFVGIEGIIDGEENDIDINGEYIGNVDKVNRKLWVEGSMEYKLLLPEEDEGFVGLEMYSIGNNSYMILEYDGDSSPWLTERLTPGSWENITGVEFELEILKNGTVNIVGSEEVRGRDCYVLQVITDEDKLVDAMIELNISTRGGLPLTESAFRELAEDSEVTHWIYKDNNYLAKFKISMRGAMTGSVLELGSKGFVEIEYIVASTIYNYNEQINIDLPPGAEEAVSLDEAASEQEARDTEFATVQAAVHAMMVDNELAMLPNPVTIPTDDMSAFPDITPAANKGSDIYGNAYNSYDKGGFILYQHDKIADGSATYNLVNYLASRYSAYLYTVDIYGTITQWD